LFFMSSQMQKSVFLALLFVYVCASARLDHPLEVSLHHIDSIPTRLVVQMKLTNVGTLPIQFLLRNTPFEGMNSNIFNVIDENGEEARYEGIVVKTGPPPPSAFVVMYPNETKSTEFDLSESYSLKSGSNYLITYSSYVHWMLGTSLVIVHPKVTDPEIDRIPYSYVPFERLNSALLLSQTIDVHVKESYRLSSLHIQQQNSNISVGISFPGCSKEKQEKINTAIGLARAMSNRAANYLSSSSCDKDFVTWFGKYTSSKWTKVKNNFHRIVSPFVTLSFAVRCDSPGCHSDWYAYVHPGDSLYTINVCHIFWSAPNSVTFDSKPGTLIHEMSHFITIAGTNDFTTTPGDSKNLAKHNPDQALNNANNYEYFAEDTPSC